MGAKRFTVVLERVGETATMFRVPFELKEARGQDAKRPEARSRRIASAVERIRAGKQHR